MSSLPQRSSALIDERVLHVDEHADRRIDPRQRLDRQDRVEEAGAGAAVAAPGISMPMTPRSNSFVDERRRRSSRARPFRGRAAGPRGRRTRTRCRGTAARLRRQRRQRRGDSSAVLMSRVSRGCECSPGRFGMLPPAAAVNRTEASAQNVAAWRLRLGYGSVDAHVIAVGAVACCHRQPAGHAQQPQQPARPSRSSRRPTSRSAADPARQPPPVFRAGINFVRVDVIVTDKKGNPVADLKADRLRGHRGRQAAEDRDVQAGRARRRPDAESTRRSAARNPDRLRRGDGGGARRRAAVRDLPRRLPRAARRQPGGPQAADRPFIENSSGRPTWSASCIRSSRPLGADDAQPRGGDARAAAVPRPQVRLHAAEPVSRRTTRTIPTEIVEKIRNQVSLSALKALIVHMGSLKEGRKALILVSEGYTNMLPPQMRNPIATMPGSGNPAAGNPLAGVERSERGSRGVDRRPRHGLRSARGLRRGQPEQRRDLRGRSARPARLRVRHQRRHRPPDRLAST